MAIITLGSGLRSMNMMVSFCDGIMSWKEVTKREHENASTDEDRGGVSVMITFPPRRKNRCTREFHSTPEIPEGVETRIGTDTMKGRTILVPLLPIVLHLDDTNENIYNSVKIDFPSDPCDTSAIPLPDYNIPGRRVSEVKCFEHTWQLRYNQINDLRKQKCDRIRYNSIGLLGGEKAENGEYPHMSAIGWIGTHGSWVFKCGGSLISERFVLTAAHCSQVRESDNTVTNQKPVIVRLGGHSILDFHPPAYDVHIKDFITHHRYKPPRQYYDIALIELDREVSFSWRIHPSCLWTKFENPGTGVLTGWGVIDLSTRMTSPLLQKANIQILHYEECDKKLSRKRNRNWWGFMRHQLCAGNLSGGVDTCQGDSGGPLQSLIPLKHPRFGLRWNLHHIIGVTSFGFGCARKNTPGVYTRVASFIGWIENIVWPDSSTRHNTTKDNRFYFET